AEDQDHPGAEVGAGRSRHYRKGGDATVDAAGDPGADIACVGSGAEPVPDGVDGVIVLERHLDRLRSQNDGARPHPELAEPSAEMIAEASPFVLERGDHDGDDGRPALKRSATNGRPLETALASGERACGNGADYREPPAPAPRGMGTSAVEGSLRAARSDRDKRHRFPTCDAARGGA